MQLRTSGFTSLIIAAIMVSSILVPGTYVMSECKPFVIDLFMGEPIPMEMMLDDLSAVKIVYLGEIHTVDRHHKVQTEILRGLSHRKLKLALGMEMFPASRQEVLDRWQQGDRDVAALERDLGKGYWTNLKDYQSLLFAAREAGATIIGLNADDDLVRKVARNGLEGLDESERKLVPEDARDVDPLHDRLLRLKLRVHRAFQNKELDRVVLAQALRDATMAAKVAGFLQSSHGKDRTMVVVAGSGHLNYGFGIPARVHKRLDAPFRIVLPSDSGELVLSEEDKRHSVPVEITHEDLRFIGRPIGDYLHFIPLKEQTAEPQPAPNEAEMGAKDQRSG